MFRFTLALILTASTLHCVSTETGLESSGVKSNQTTLARLDKVLSSTGDSNLRRVLQDVREAVESGSGVHPEIFDAWRSPGSRGWGTEVCRVLYGEHRLCWRYRLPACHDYRVLALQPSHLPKGCKGGSPRREMFDLRFGLFLLSGNSLIEAHRYHGPGLGEYYSEGEVLCLLAGAPLQGCMQTDARFERGQCVLKTGSIKACISIPARESPGDLVIAAHWDEGATPPLQAEPAVYQEAGLEPPALPFVPYTPPRGD